MKNIISLISLTLAIAPYQKLIGQQFHLYANPGITYSSAGLQSYMSNGKERYEPSSTRESDRKAANDHNYSLGLEMEVGRFDRRSVISENVIKSMNRNASIASKYKKINDNYLKSTNKFGELADLTKSFANAASKGSIINEATTQQRQIIEEALKNYHLAQDLVELSETRLKLMDDAAKQLILEHGLSEPQILELKQLNEKAKTCNRQLLKLLSDRDKLGKQTEFARSETAKNIQLAGQLLIAASKMADNTIKIAAEYLGPVSEVDKARHAAIGIGKETITEYIKQRYENDKPLSEAISLGFQKGYESAKNATFNQYIGKNYKDLKNITLIPKMVNEVIDQLNKFEEIDGKKRREAIDSYNRAMEFSQQAIMINQTCIEQSIRQSKIIVDLGIDDFLNK